MQSTFARCAGPHECTAQRNAQCKPAPAPTCSNAVRSEPPELRRGGTPPEKAPPPPDTPVPPLPGNMGGRPKGSMPPPPEDGSRPEAARSAARPMRKGSGVAPPPECSVLRRFFSRCVRLRCNYIQNKWVRKHQ